MTAPPKCGRPKAKAKYGNLLCKASRVKAPDGRWAPGCGRHLAAGERAAYGLPPAAPVKGGKR